MNLIKLLLNHPTIILITLKTSWRLFIWKADALSPIMFHAISSGLVGTVYQHVPPSLLKIEYQSAFEKKNVSWGNIDLIKLRHAGNERQICRTWPIYLRVIFSRLAARTRPPPAQTKLLPQSCGKLMGDYSWSDTAGLIYTRQLPS